MKRTEIAAFILHILKSQNPSPKDWIYNRFPPFVSEPHFKSVLNQMARQAWISIDGNIVRLRSVGEEMLKP